MYPGTFADQTPDRPAIVMDDGGRTVTYAELDERSTRLANLLHARGLRRGDHVAFVAPNAPEIFEIYWAAMRSGLYVTGVNFHLTPDEASYIIDDCGARVLLVSAHVGELVRELPSRLEGLELALAFGGSVPGYDAYEPALADASPTRPSDQPAGADMLYSSGTTGQPKGVLPALPETQVDQPGDPFASVFGPVYGFDADTVYFSAAPLYHAAPLRFGGIVHRYGGTLVLGTRFDAEASLRAIDAHRVTHSQWVPTMFVRMLKLDGAVRERYEMSSMRVAVHAAAPCPVDVKQAMFDWWGPVLHEYYSSTEANGITMIGPQEWLSKPGSVGQAKLGVAHICDEDGVELSAGEVGTIYFERERMPFAYHNDAAKTDGARHPLHETWSAVGDVGYLDEDGYLFLTDRKAFMIISGGVNIYPQEAEDALVTHPAVYDVAVIGVPDPDMGERVKAIIQLADGYSADAPTARALVDFARSRLAHYKAPRSVSFLDELPRTATGKLVKRRLRDIDMGAEYNPLDD